MWHTGLVAPRHVGSSCTRARTRVPCMGRRILNHCTTREARSLYFKLTVCSPPQHNVNSPIAFTAILHRRVYSLLRIKCISRPTRICGSHQGKDLCLIHGCDPGVSQRLWHTAAQSLAQTLCCTNVQLLMIPFQRHNFSVPEKPDIKSQLHCL